MNENLKQDHMRTIINEHAVRMYSMLCEACELREGGMTDADQMLVADVARFEGIKQQLIDDIQKNGIGKERFNGRQSYWQENKSVGQLRQYAEQQRKHLAELKLTPQARRAAAVDVDDEFSTF